MLRRSAAFGWQIHCYVVDDNVDILSTAESTAFASEITKPFEVITYSPHGPQITK